MSYVWGEVKQLFHQTSGHAPACAKAAFGKKCAINVHSSELHNNAMTIIHLYPVGEVVMKQMHTHYCDLE